MPPVGHSWEEISACADVTLGERIDAGLAACRQQWPRQLDDAFPLAHFTELDPSALRQALERCERFAASAPDHGPFHGHVDLLGRLYMVRSGHSAKQWRGEFYTPGHVGLALTMIASIEPGMWVVEPACGSGQILAAAVAAVRSEHGYLASQSVSYVGVELVRDSSTLGRMQMLLTGHDPDGFHIFCGDSLRQSVVGRDRAGTLRAMEFHAALANPPFGTKVSAPLEPGDPLEVPSELLERRLLVERERGKAMVSAGLARRPVKYARGLLP